MAGDLGFALLALVSLFGSARSEGYPGGAGGYPGGAGGYPGGGEYPGGPNGYGAGYLPAFVPAPVYQEKEEKKLIEVDKLFARLEDLSADFHVAKEILDASRARIAVFSQRKNELSASVAHFVGRRAEQSQTRDTLDELLDDTEDMLNDLQDVLISEVSPNNSMNSAGLITEEVRIVMAKSDNVEQDAALASLGVQIRIVKKELYDLAILTFKQATNNAETLKDASKSVLDLTLNKRYDKRATALFQTTFNEDTPNLMWGIAGYTFNLNVRDEKEPDYPPYGGGYSHYHPDPNAVGLLVMGDASPEGVTFHVNNMAFGDSDLVAVKVNYQACNLQSVFGISMA
ncbi:hypothetical protein ACOMHN_066754 [Nucella lapillus]